MSFAGLDAVFPDPAAFTRTSYSELAREAGVPFESLRRVALELGLPQPEPDNAVREDDARMLDAFLSGGAPAGRDEGRSSRVLGASLRPLVDSYLQIVGPAFARHFQTLDLPVDERARRTGELGRSGTDLLEQ